MSQSSNRSMKYLVVGIIIFSIGVIIGLVVLGWWLWPVEWVDADVEDMRIEYKERYLRSAIDSYSLNRDLVVAQQFLNDVGSDNLIVLERIENNPGNQNPEAIRVFSYLAQGQEIDSTPEPSIPEKYQVREVEVTRVVEKIITQVITNTAEINVVTETPEPKPPKTEPPVEEPKVRGKVALLAGSDTTKLQALGFLNGIDIVRESKISRTEKLLGDPDVAGVLLNFSKIYPGETLLLDAIINRGGNVIVFYSNETFSEEKEAIEDVFGIAHAEEEIFYSSEEYFGYSDVLLPSWLKDLKIATTCSNNAQLNTYLLTLGSNDEEGYYQSQETGKERLMYISRLGGKLLFIAQPDYSCRSFFSDSQIDSVDNEEATLRILRFLSERTLTPISIIKPDNVTNEHIEDTRRLYEQVSNGEITKEEADSELVVIMTEIGKDGMAWIVSHTPIYSEQQKSWITINDYLDELGEDGEINPNSRLNQDPVGTAVDLFFGDFESGDILNWLGFDE